VAISWDSPGTHLYLLTHGLATLPLLTHLCLLTFGLSTLSLLAALTVDTWSGLVE